MIYDRQQMAVDYATCYADKSRITFIEKYFSTFNAMKGKKTQFHCFPRQRAFLKALAENRNVVAVKPRQCGITTLSSAWAAAQCAFAPADAQRQSFVLPTNLSRHRKSSSRYAISLSKFQGGIGVMTISLQIQILRRI